MINLTSRYPTQVFLPVAASQLMARIDRINLTGIPTLDFPKKYRRANNGVAPDGSGVLTSQIDVLINNNATYAFQTLKDAQSYGQQAANQMVNNACYYIENIQPTYYQMIVWGVA